MEVLDIISASLKYLTIDSCTDVIDEDENGYNEIAIKISCPNLVLFDYGAPVARNYFLENLLSLDMVCIFLMPGYHVQPDETIGRLMCEVLEKIPNTTVLKLSMGVIWCIGSVLDRLKCSCVTFHGLKSLTVWLAIDECLLRLMVLLLKYSPNLESLTLVSESIEDWSGTWELQDDGITCLESKLKLVHLAEFRGDENEFELVKFLLKHGLVLEKMIIPLASCAEKSTSIAETILGFPKSSPDLAVTVLESSASDAKLKRLKLTGF